MRNKAFTLAEILISLTIIGVIAALTLPALMANLNEKVWNTKRKALHSRMAQELAAMPNLDRFPDNDDGTAEFNFVNSGLAMTYNITKICSDGGMNKCDFYWPEYAMNDEVFAPPKMSILAFNTVNGESIGVWSYNKSCTGESNADFLTSNDILNMQCVNLLYDLNGASKGPNKIGKDMGFITAFFPEYPLVIAPMPVLMTGDEVNASRVEDILAANSEYRLPSPAEASLIANRGRYLGNVELENVWADNNIICNSRTCTKATSTNSKMTKAEESSAYLVLVSKEGDAPKKFKTIKKEKEELKPKECDPDEMPDKKCATGWTCGPLGTWYCPGKI